jgi:hypothetical protein
METEDRPRNDRVLDKWKHMVRQVTSISDINQANFQSIEPFCSHCNSGGHDEVYNIH